MMYYIWPYIYYTCHLYVTPGHNARMRYIWQRWVTPGYHGFHLTTLPLASTLGQLALRLAGMKPWVHGT